MIPSTSRAIVLWSLGLACSPALAATLTVPVGASVQAAIEAAAEGDVLRLEAGEYPGNLDFRGKALSLVGVGPASVVRGTGDGPVITIAAGEGPGTVVDSLTVTGGVAERGGGLLVRDASPTVLRTVVVGNRARLQGSGVHLERSAALLTNNLVVYNGSAAGDPHSVEVQDAAPTLVNNTIARGDSNGLILRGASPAIVMNNVLAYNGSLTDGAPRGRGICDFSGGTALIAYNLFFRNRVAALLTDGRDFRRIGAAERAIGAPRLVGNRDGRPEFRRRARRRPSAAPARDFALRRGRPRRARDRGNPDAVFLDPDGTRNDIGFTGGPLTPVRPGRAGDQPGRL